MTAASRWDGDDRTQGLRRFAIAISILNLLGHTWFGFEQSWAVPLVALAAAYSTELLLEIIDASIAKRPFRFSGGPMRVVDCLLSAHISALAVGMLLYSNERLAPVAFAAIFAVASKALFRIPVGAGSRHVMNPSNIAITATLLLFPWVGIAPPYQFTENLGGIGDWVLPLIIIGSGSLLNYRFTHRLPLITAWLGGFFAQAFVRGLATDAGVAASLSSSLVPVTGLAFVLFTFYMITDPATTPESTKAQIAFGLAVALTYGTLVALHIVFDLFFALSVVAAGRGVGCYALAWAVRRSLGVSQAGVPATTGRV
jgi:enediyne biosynthesis protein E5